MNLREIPGHEHYFVGDDGTVWSTKRKGGNDRQAGRTGALRQLKIQRNSRGYCVVNLDCSGLNKTRFVHQLVLEAFVGPKPDGMEACHYPDHDKSNNALRNLRWDSHAENMGDDHRDRGPLTNKRCRRCGHERPIAEFYKDKRSSDGHKSQCKACHKEVNIATRDPEKKRAANREYMRRARTIR